MSARKHDIKWEFVECGVTMGIVAFASLLVATVCLAQPMPTRLFVVLPIAYGIWAERQFALGWLSLREIFACEKLHEASS